MDVQASEHELAPERVAELKDAQLVDVRTAGEYEASHLEGALHVPLERLQESTDQLDREQPVVFYCRSGERSKMAVEAFRASGWDAYAIDGGLVTWADSGLPVEPKGAEVAHHSGLPPA
jgi:rhodanese-related sulfurtransferase